MRQEQQQQRPGQPQPEAAQQQAKRERGCRGGRGNNRQPAPAVLASLIGRDLRLAPPELRTLYSLYLDISREIQILQQKRWDLIRPLVSMLEARVPKPMQPSQPSRPKQQHPLQRQPQPQPQPQQQQLQPQQTQQEQQPQQHTQPEQQQPAPTAPVHRGKLATKQPPPLDEMLAPLSAPLRTLVAQAVGQCAHHPTRGPLPPDLIPRLVAIVQPVDEKPKFHLHMAAVNAGRKAASTRDADEQRACAALAAVVGAEVAAQKEAKTAKQQQRVEAAAQRAAAAAAAKQQQRAALNQPAHQDDPAGNAAAAAASGARPRNSGGEKKGPTTRAVSAALRHSTSAASAASTIDSASSGSTPPASQVGHNRDEPAPLRRRARGK